MRSLRKYLRKRQCTHELCGPYEEIQEITKDLEQLQRHAYSEFYRTHDLFHAYDIRTFWSVTMKEPENIAKWRRIVECAHTASKYIQSNIEEYKYVTGRFKDEGDFYWLNQILAHIKCGITPQFEMVCSSLSCKYSHGTWYICQGRSAANTRGCNICISDKDVWYSLSAVLHGKIVTLNSRDNNIDIDVIDESYDIRSPNRTCTIERHNLRPYSSYNFSIKGCKMFFVCKLPPTHTYRCMYHYCTDTVMINGEPRCENLHKWSMWRTVYALRKKIYAAVTKMISGDIPDGKYRVNL